VPEAVAMLQEVKPTPTTLSDDTSSMTPEEFREMVSKSQNGGPDDDCLMCGS